MVTAILYLLRSGCPWRLLPKGFPPRSTVQRYFYAWRDDATWRRINHHLLMAAREAVHADFSERRVARAVEDMNEICHTHQDYMWDVLIQVP